MSEQPVGLAVPCVSQQLSNIITSISLSVNFKHPQLICKQRCTQIWALMYARTARDFFFFFFQTHAHTTLYSAEQEMENIIGKNERGSGYEEGSQI